MGRKPTYAELEKRLKELEKKGLEQKRVDEIMQLYQFTVERAIDSVFWLDSDGRIFYVNEAAAAALQYSREELLSMSVFDIDPAFERRSWREHWEELRTKRTLTLESLHRRKDGTRFPVELLINRIECGDREYNCTSARDVSRYELAERALREREEHYRAIVEAFDGLIYICSQDYRVEFMNQRSVERTGYDGIGGLCYEVLHDRDSICPWCVNEQVFEGKTVRWEVISPKDNRWYYVVNTPIYHPDGRLSKQAMLLDITERKQMEEALRESSEKTKLFAYSVSHDLKSPAVGIHGLASLLQRHYGEMLDERGKSYCAQILKAAEQVAALVEKINTYMAAKETVLNVERVNLKELLQMVREEFSPRLSIHQIGWLEPEKMPGIRADRLSLLRVFRNLVDNALKYGGENLSEIRIGYKKMRAFHVISVSDDGVPINGEDSEKIFGLFQRHPTSRGTEGTGIGLAIVKELAEKHGGRVWMEPRPIRGKTFHVSISKGL